MIKIALDNNGTRKRTFLMNVAAANIKKTSAGTCPHGLPYGACRICSGGGAGGSGVSSKKARPAGEMSWEQCNAVWQQMLKAKERAEQKKLDNQHAQLLHQQTSFSARLENMAQKIADLTQKLNNFAQTTNLPKIIAKPLTILVQIAIPVLNVIKTVTNFAQQALTNVQQKLADISDKLNSIFGELKNATEKKISDNLKNIKRKFKTIFGLYETEELSEEEKEAEEAEKIIQLYKDKKITQPQTNTRNLEDDNEN